MYKNSISYFLRTQPATLDKVID